MKKFGKWVLLTFLTVIGFYFAAFVAYVLAATGVGLIHSWIIWEVSPVFSSMFNFHPTVTRFVGLILFIAALFFRAPSQLKTSSFKEGERVVVAERFKDLLTGRVGVVLSSSKYDLAPDDCVEVDFYGDIRRVPKTILRKRCTY